MTWYSINIYKHVLLKTFFRNEIKDVPRLTLKGNPCFWPNYLLSAVDDKGIYISDGKAIAPYTHEVST